MACTILTVQNPIPTVTLNDYGFAECTLALCATYNKICTTVPFAQVNGDKVAFWANYTVANWTANVKITVTWNDGTTTYTTTVTSFSLVPGTYTVPVESTVLYAAGKTYTITGFTATIV